MNDWSPARGIICKVDPELHNFKERNYLPHHHEIK